MYRPEWRYTYMAIFGVAVELRQGCMMSPLLSIYIWTACCDAAEGAGISDKGISDRVISHMRMISSYWYSPSLKPSEPSEGSTSFMPNQNDDQRDQVGGNGGLEKSRETRY